MSVGLTLSAVNLLVTRREAVTETTRRALGAFTTRWSDVPEMPPYAAFRWGLSSPIRAARTATGLDRLLPWTGVIAALGRP
jgi:hypothetical protein